ncbi:homeobox-domain-containing protein [Sparassis crispa]|uniref:Homeobox-domain-containing protein n=1 Tax=Sparassis crispa TaxID=139825 RepID=A0A401G5D1_9APHY|nr:homeobox-domain-containing protein [Sparassis crispa]GBE77364.1 homeobox-domain-containing protein [Sparassis crispa]
MSSRAQPLCRSSSASSIASDDTTQSCDTVDTSVSSQNNADVIRRTRKRFTNVQLMMLEHLYHETSHPTREQREGLARSAELETRSVTVWFQNKRQTERRVALHNATTGAPQSALYSTPSDSTKHPRPARRASTDKHTHTQRPLLAGHLSLDRVAARSERPSAPYPSRTPSPLSTFSPAPTVPTTPPKRSASLWEMLPSSPMVSPSALDPKAERTLVDFGRRRLHGMRTLEWACAAARVEGRVEKEPVQEQESAEREPSEDDMVLDLGEEDVHEAVAPKTTVSCRLHNGVESEKPNKENIRVTATFAVYVPVKIRRKSGREAPELRDEDVMNAALALCGLGRS